MMITRQCYKNKAESSEVSVSIVLFFSDFRWARHLVQNIETVNEKTIWIFDQVRHKPGCSHRIKLEAGNFGYIYYPCGENEGADQPAQLICVFVIAYAIVGFFVRMLDIIKRRK